jgi:hypothetical protein
MSEDIVDILVLDRTLLEQTVQNFQVQRYFIQCLPTDVRKLVTKHIHTNMSSTVGGVSMQDVEQNTTNSFDPNIAIASITAGIAAIGGVYAYRQHKKSQIADQSEKIPYSINMRPEPILTPKAQDDGPIKYERKHDCEDVAESLKLSKAIETENTAKIAALTKKSKLKQKEIETLTKQNEEIKAESKKQERESAEHRQKHDKDLQELNQAKTKVDQNLAAKIEACDNLEKKNKLLKESLSTADADIRSTMEQTKRQENTIQEKESTIEKLKRTIQTLESEKVKANQTSKENIITYEATKRTAETKWAESIRVLEIRLEEQKTENAEQLRKLRETHSLENQKIAENTASEKITVREGYAVEKDKLTQIHNTETQVKYKQHAEEMRNQAIKLAKLETLHGTQQDILDQTKNDLAKAKLEIQTLQEQNDQISTTTSASSVEQKEKIKELIETHRTREENTTRDLTVQCEEQKQNLKYQLEQKDEHIVKLRENNDRLMSESSDAEVARKTLTSKYKINEYQTWSNITTAIISDKESKADLIKKQQKLYTKINSLILGYDSEEIEDRITQQIQAITNPFGPKELKPSLVGEDLYKLIMTIRATKLKSEEMLGKFWKAPDNAGTFEVEEKKEHEPNQEDKSTTKLQDKIGEFIQFMDTDRVGDNFQICGSTDWLPIRPLAVILSRLYSFEHPTTLTSLISEINAHNQKESDLKDDMFSLNNVILGNIDTSNIIYKTKEGNGVGQTLSYLQTKLNTLDEWKNISFFADLVTLTKQIKLLTQNTKIAENQVHPWISKFYGAWQTKLDVEQRMIAYEEDVESSRYWVDQHIILKKKLEVTNADHVKEVAELNSELHKKQEELISYAGKVDAENRCKKELNQVKEEILEIKKALKTATKLSDICNKIFDESIQSVEQLFKITNQLKQSTLLEEIISDIRNNKSGGYRKPITNDESEYIKTAAANAKQIQSDEDTQGFLQQRKESQEIQQYIVALQDCREINTGLIAEGNALTEENNHAQELVQILKQALHDPDGFLLRQSETITKLTQTIGEQNMYISQCKEHHR